MLDLNNTLVTIRERSLRELYDVALHLLWLLRKPLAVAFVAGMLPCALFNLWWLGELPFADKTDYWHYIYLYTLLCWWWYPFATAPITVLLGQAMFQRKIEYRRALYDYLSSLPQLLWMLALRTTVMPHGLIMVDERLTRSYAIGLGWLVVLWLLPLLRWAYLPEVILLERNPWRKKAGWLSTGQRSRALHGGDGGLIFGRGIAGIFWEQLLLQTVWLSAWYLWMQLARPAADGVVFGWLFPAALWLVLGFQSIVRFLSYLDLRIRREGWEVDLALRAEADLLAHSGRDSSTRSPSVIREGVHAK